jgi:predicted metal-dependent HD superfamily phosphohydrolase
MSEINQSELLSYMHTLAAEFHTDLPYHNFPRHVLGAIADAYKLNEELEQNNIEIDMLVVEVALLFHDAGYHLDHIKMGFESKEALSAHIADHVLTHYGAPREFIVKVAGCIMATHLEGVPITNEEYLVRAADVGNVSGEFWTFVRNGINLAKEGVIFGKALPETHAAFWQGSSAYLQYYVGKPAVFVDKNGNNYAVESSYLNAQRNLERIAKLSQLPMRSLARFLPDFEDLVPSQWLNK